MSHSYYTISIISLCKNVAQPFRLAEKSQAGSLGYNAHLIERNGISNVKSGEDGVFYFGIEWAWKGKLSPASLLSPCYSVSFRG